MKRTDQRQNRVARLLRGRILRGTYAGRLPGERVLAKEFGTTTRTIELALMRLSNVGLIQREERRGSFVVPPDQRPGAAPILYAKLTVGAPDNLTDYKGFWTAPVCYAFQETAKEHGINMVLEYSGDVDKTVEHVLSEATSEECVGTCMLAMAVEDRHTLRLAEAGGAVVVADWDLSEPFVPCVVFDDHSAGRRLAEHLVSLGHRRMMYLPVRTHSPSQTMRARGVDEYLKAMGLAPCSRVTPPVESISFVQSFVTSRPRATALICADSILAHTLVLTLPHRGVRVPEDVSIVTFGSGLDFQMTHATMAEFDHVQMGQQALKALLDEQLLAEPRRVLVPAKLTLGETTGPAPA